MHCYINGKSLETKQKNWDLLNNVSTMTLLKMSLYLNCSASDKVTWII